MTMVCDRCGQAGIRWMGPLANLTHTECPHCGGLNCQGAAFVDEEDEVEELLASDLTPKQRDAIEAAKEKIARVIAKLEDAHSLIVEMLGLGDLKAVTIVVKEIAE
jgi:hypothetical protein